MSDRLKAMMGIIPTEPSVDLSPSYRVWAKTGAIVVIDEKADVPADTLIWHFARILAWASVGIDCSIGAGAELGRGVMVGNRTRISANVFLPPHAVIGANVFIGPGAIFTDDRYPRILDHGELYEAQPPIVEDYASIGAGAVILPGIRIGEHALVGAGAIVTHDVPKGAVVIGGPAREITRKSSIAQLPTADTGIAPTPLVP